MVSKALVYVSSKDIVECIHEASIENFLIKLSMNPISKFREQMYRKTTRSN